MKALLSPSWWVGGEGGGLALWRALTHHSVQHRVAGHIAQEGGSRPYHIRVARLQEAGDLWQALFLESNQLAHATGHLRKKDGVRT